MRKFQPESRRQSPTRTLIRTAETERSLPKTMAQFNFGFKKNSPLLPAILLIVFACCAPEKANSQASAPRMESDGRPAKPPAAKPTATAQPTRGREVPPPQATASRTTPNPINRPSVPNGGDSRPDSRPLTRPATPATPSSAATSSPLPPLPRSKPTATPSKPMVTKPTPAVPAVTEPSKKFPKIVTKLMIDDLQSGRGRQAKPGAKLVVHFTSWLYDPTQPLGRGPQYETTQGKTPYKFTLQNPDALHIKGWEDGIVDMKTGGRRRLIIPPELGYGPNGAGQVIPPGATLLYEIELIDVE